MTVVWALAVTACAGGGRDAGHDATAPAGSGPEEGTVFLVRDNGVRCVTHPCFHVDVVAEGSEGPAETVSDVDLSAVARSDAERASLLERLAREGIRAAGRIETVPDAGPAGEGRVFHVQRLVG